MKQIFPVKVTINGMFILVDMCECFGSEQNVVIIIISGYT